MRIARTVLPAALAAAALVGCSAGPHHAAGTPRSHGGVRLTWSEPETSPTTLLVLRRIRYEGATLRTMYVHRDGSVSIDVPNGGAGGSKYAGRIAPGTFAVIRHEIATIPWHHLSRRKRFLDASGGYFIVRHGDSEHVAMSDGMSVDLLPLVRRLQGVFNGGLRDKRVLHRFGRL